MRKDKLIEYQYDSRWNKLTKRLKMLQPEDCVSRDGDEVMAVFSDKQLLAISGAVDSAEPLPLGDGRYSISERAKAAGYIVGYLSDTPTGKRIKLFRSNRNLAEIIRRYPYGRTRVRIGERFE